MSARKVLATFGRRGRPDYVRVIAETVGTRAMARVQWREGGKLRTESWRHTRVGLTEAKAYAELTHDRLRAKPVQDIGPIALAEMFSRYLIAEEDGLSPFTIRTTTERWRKFEIFAGASTHAASITREKLDDYKKALLKLGHAPNQVSLHLGVVRLVYRWAEDRDLVPPTKVPTYRTKLSKALRQSGPEMAEYTREDAQAILRAMDPRARFGWRPYVLTTLFAYCGRRQHAARHLTWRDVDFAGGRICWRAQYDKMKRPDRWQPVPEPVIEALWVAYGWRIAEAYRGPWIFIGGQRASRGEALELPAWAEDAKHKRRGKRQRRVEDRPWSYGSYNEALHTAEDAAGIARKKWKAAHAFRRGVAGDIYEMTGSEKDAADYIGDESVKVVRKHYLLTRDEKLRAVATGLAGLAVPPNNAQSTNGETSSNATSAHNEAPEGELAHE